MWTALLAGTADGNMKPLPVALLSSIAPALGLLMVVVYGNPRSSNLVVTSGPGNKEAGDEGEGDGDSWDVTWRDWVSIQLARSSPTKR